MDNGRNDNRNKGFWDDRKPKVCSDAQGSQPTNTDSVDDWDNAWNDSGNGTFTETTENDGKVDENRDEYWDVDEKENSNYNKNKTSTIGYRKSESFVSHRQEKRTYSRYSDSGYSRPVLEENLADSEYKEFQRARHKMDKVVFDKVIEIEEDLFKMPEEYSLGHCVATDMRMGSGIAVAFK